MSVAIFYHLPSKTRKMLKIWHIVTKYNAFILVLNSYFKSLVKIFIKSSSYPNSPLILQATIASQYHSWDKNIQPNHT